MKVKTFDCVEIKHRGAEKVREQTKEMTLKQELAFWQERSRILNQRQKVAKGKSHTLASEEQQDS